MLLVPEYKCGSAMHSYQFPGIKESNNEENRKQLNGWWMDEIVARYLRLALGNVGTPRNPRGIILAL